MVHSEVYPNKYVVSMAPFSPPPIQKTALFACFRFLIFCTFFHGGQLTPFAAICGRPCSCGTTHFTFQLYFVLLVVYSSFTRQTLAFRACSFHPYRQPRLKNAAPSIWNTLPLEIRTFPCHFLDQPRHLPINDCPHRRCGPL